MGFFDFVSEKVSELTSGGVEEVANQIQEASQGGIEDATQQVEDVVAQAEDILPGGDNQQ